MRTFIFALLLASFTLAGYIETRAFTNVTQYGCWTNKYNGTTNSFNDGDSLWIVTAMWTYIRYEFPEIVVTGPLAASWSKVAFYGTNGYLTDTNAAFLVPMCPDEIVVAQHPTDVRPIYLTMVTQGTYNVSYWSGGNTYSVWDTNKLFFTPNLEVRTKLSAYTLSQYVTTVAKPLTGAWLRVNDTYWTNQANGYMLTNGPDAWTIYAANWTSVLCSNAPQSVAATRSFTNIAFIHEAGIVISASYPIVFNITTNTYTTKITNSVDITKFIDVSRATTLTRAHITTTNDHTGYWYPWDATVWTNETSTFVLSNRAIFGWTLYTALGGTLLATNQPPYSLPTYGFTNKNFAGVLSWSASAFVAADVLGTSSFVANQICYINGGTYTNWAFQHAGYMWTNIQQYSMTGTSTWGEAHGILTNKYAANIPQGMSNVTVWIPANPATWMMPRYVPDNYTNAETFTVTCDTISNMAPVTIEHHSGYMYLMGPGVFKLKAKRPKSIYVEPSYKTR